MGRLRRWVALTALMAAGAAAAETREYTIDAGESDVHWLVFKAGTLSRLGHNHVISVPNLTGTVTVDDENPAASHFELSFPVASLVVDDPALRAAAGPDFSSVPSADDIAGTRKNMLGEKVLDGERYPTITVKGAGPMGADGEQSIKMTVTMLGRSVDVAVPTHVERDAAGLTASGDFELKQTALGMVPFSVMLGALQVADEMKFHYRIRAIAKQ